MKVRLRPIDEGLGSLLCEIEPTREAIDSLVLLLSNDRGVYCDDGEFRLPTDWQFVLDDNGAYLEIILGHEPELE